MGECQEQIQDRMEYRVYNEYTFPRRLKQVCQQELERLQGKEQCMLHNQNNDLHRPQMYGLLVLAWTWVLVRIHVTFVQNRMKIPF